MKSFNIYDNFSTTTVAHLKLWSFHHLCLNCRSTSNQKKNVFLDNWNLWKFIQNHATLKPVSLFESNKTLINVPAQFTHQQIYHWWEHQQHWRIVLCDIWRTWRRICSWFCQRYSRQELNEQNHRICKDSKRAAASDKPKEFRRWQSVFKTEIQLETEGRKCQFVGGIITP